MIFSKVVSHRALRKFGRRFDLLPVWASTALGLLAAAALTLLAATIPWHYGAILISAVLVGCFWLAYRAQPVADITAVEPESFSREVFTEIPDLALVRLPGGEFTMGSPEDEEGRFKNEGPQHQVMLSSFNMMETLVTRRLYMEIMGKDPSYFKGESDQRPVETVFWRDAIRFCNQLSRRLGLKPCYKLFGTRVWRRRGGDGFRLPTEAEWEYSCRAGTTTRYYFGDDAEALERYAWYEKNSSGQTHPVATREPNDWGLYDMHGNVWEWCWDRFGDYRKKPEVNPVGPWKGIRFRNPPRVVRGGGFNNEAGCLRSADRDGGEPSGRDGDLGFRCVRAPRRRH